MTKTLPVDAKKIDQVLIDMSKLIIRLEKNSKKTRKDQNVIITIKEIRDRIQDVHTK